MFVMWGGGVCKLSQIISNGFHLIISTDMVEFILISKNILSMILFDLKLIFVALPFSTFVVYLFVCLFVISFCILYLQALAIRWLNECAHFVKKNSYFFAVQIFLGCLVSSLFLIVTVEIFVFLFFFFLLVKFVENFYDLSNTKRRKIIYTNIHESTHKTRLHFIHLFTFLNPTFFQLKPMWFFNID